MKINKKKAVTWVIDVLLVCCCAVLLSCVIEPTFYAVYDFTEWMPSCVVFVLCWAAILLVAMAIIASFMFLLAIVEIAFSDDLQEELAEQLETSDDETEYQEKAAIASDHGDNLKTVMEAIRREKWEYDAVFNLSGEKLAEGTYQSPDICNIPPEDWQELKQRGKAVVELHNHPGIFNTSFSDADFEVFLQKDFIRKSIVVTRKYNYILTKTGKGYEKFAEEAKAYAEKAFTSYFWLGLFSIRLLTVLVSRKTAEKFGLEFSVERVHQAAGKNRFQIGLATCAIAILCLTLTGSNITTEGYSLPSSSETAVATTVYFDYSTYDDTHFCEGVISESLVDEDSVLANCSPLNDACIQGHAPVGGGPN